MTTQPGPRRPTRIAALTLSMAYAAFLLTGCTSGPSPSPSTTPSSSTSSSGTTNPPTTSSPSPTVSLDIPAAAKEKSVKGGIEFAKWFTDKSSESYVTLETGWMALVSTASCGACQALVKDVESFKVDGVRLDRKRFKFTASQTMDAVRLPAFEVDIVGDELAANVVDSGGKVVQSDPAGKSWLRYGVLWVTDSWRVTSILAVNP